MEEKRKRRQKYFVAKELRLSIALIVLWAFLAVALFTFVVKELGHRIEHNIFTFVLIMLGYAVIVIFLSMVFAHRFVGPFQRLKMEIDFILAGEYNRRLGVRRNDDLYIRSFVGEVNKLLTEFERMHYFKEELHRSIDAELLHIINVIEDERIPKEKHREAVLAFHRKVKSLLED